MRYDDELGGLDGTVEADDSACTAADDGLLLTHFLVGEQTAFAELVRRHGGMVLRVCQRVLGNATDAEDATQLVFSTLAERARRLAERRSLAGWLHGAAWHIAMRARRARQSRTRAERRAGMASAATAAARRSGQLADAEDRELCVEVDRALALLPDAYREVLILHHIEGLTVQQAALRMGCAPGTVASRLSRGRVMLGAKLRERGITLGLSVLVVILEEEIGRTAVATAATVVAATAVAVWSPPASNAPIALHARLARRGAFAGRTTANPGSAADTGGSAAPGGSLGHPAPGQAALGGHWGGAASAALYRKVRLAVSGWLVFGGVAAGAAGAGAVAWNRADAPLQTQATPAPQTQSAPYSPPGVASLTMVPEPSSVTVLATTGGWVLLRRRRQLERQSR